MATLHIPDEVLRQLGLDERGAMVEFACRLYDAEKLSLGLAARLAGLNRSQFEDALIERGLPVYRLTEATLAEDLAAIERLKG